ncbi:hypothetical protein [Psychrobacter pygoscelis]|uniref:hypothetical protein n=1 Tax=Psychrobacter pygoscelis TaxID=2488563 RepID=UPI00103AA2DD|nr:hypothetical protein [Psychrobacter pygoscelis]
MTMSFNDEKLMAAAERCGVKGDISQIKHFALIIGSSRDNNLFGAVQRLKYRNGFGGKVRREVIDACLDVIEVEHEGIEEQVISYNENQKWKQKKTSKII